MTEILLVRHAQSLANKRDFAAFGNVESPLTEKGIGQAQGLNATFKTEFGIAPETYDRPVLASEFTRPRQTAELAGFKHIDRSSIINESDIDVALTGGREIIKKHRQEHWVPESVAHRAEEFIDKVGSGELDYEIYFTHGLFIAAVLLECDVRLVEFETTFDDERGYVPLQASITKLSV